MHTFSSITFTESPEENASCIVIFINENHEIISTAGQISSQDIKNIAHQNKALCLQESGIASTLSSETNIRYISVYLDKKVVSIEDFQSLGAKIFKQIKNLKPSTLTISWPEVNKNRANIEQYTAVLKGMYHASYAFTAYKSDQPTPQEIQLNHAGKNIHLFKQAFEAAICIIEGEQLAKDLMNEPANILTPIEFCNRIKQLHHLGLDIEILDEAKCRSERMYALLSVGQGSAQPSRLACIKWNGDSRKKEPPVALIGKGVCFDSGGINLKRAMLTEMKYDMGGAAAVVGAMASIAKQKLPVNVIGIVALTENMTGSQAYRPSDIISSRAGKTIEVLNTDAEGRLILADAIDYATDFNPKAIIDIATLTGAIIVALGHEYAGLFSNDKTLTNKLNIASKRSGEKLWELPLDKAFDALMDSPIADCQNIPTQAGQAGSITAAQFLQRFTKEMPWAHIDIAGTAWRSGHSVHGKGPTGYGVGLLTELVAEYVNK